MSTTVFGFLFLSFSETNEDVLINYNFPLAEATV